MSINLIAAMAENRCIGKDGKLPWHLPEDMKHFKELTMGKTVLMGRKTWESIPERFRPLTGRKNIVLTRDPHYSAPEGVERFTSLEEALTQHKDLFIIGGADVYQQSLSRATIVHLTLVHQHIDGDAFFPPLPDAEWKLVEQQKHEAYSFLTYSRI